MHHVQRRALVAGGAGFIGSHLCDRLLTEGMEIVCVDDLQTGSRANLVDCLDHPRFRFVEADIAERLPRGAASERYDEVYNLASAGSPLAYQADPEHTMMTNVVGTRQLLRLAEGSSARFLLTSTCEVYGDPGEHPQVETYCGNVNPVGPRACHDEGKRAAETLAADFDRQGRVAVRIARVFNTYGPRLSSADGRVVSNLIVQALTGRPLTVYGNGAQTRSFCYVDDLVDGLIRLMRHDGPQPGPVNLGNPAEISVLELAQRIDALVDGHGVMVRLPLPEGDPHRRRPDIAKAARVLGWTPTTDLDAGLRATIAWFAAAQAPADTAPHRPIDRAPIPAAASSMAAGATA